MDALTRGPTRVALLLAPLLVAVNASAYRTANFLVSAPTPQLAKEIGDSAEAWRKSLAVEWLGQEMPAWSKPCPIRARVAPQLGAGGATSFIFDQGEVFGWEMNIQGSRERVLDSVLPHEVTHTIFASHFRQPLPRWADEGACTTVEHESEVRKQERMLIRFLKTGKGIPFDKMFAMREYPPDVLPLYSQGHSLTQFLIERRGRAAFLAFLGDGMQSGEWPRAVRDHYGHTSLMDLQVQWLDWVKAGRPRLSPEPAPTAIASAAPAPRTDPSVVPASLATPAGPPPATRVEPGESVYAAMARRGTPASAVTGAPLRDSTRPTGVYWR